MTDIDDDLRLAVECLVEAQGTQGAVEELQARADAGADGPGAGPRPGGRTADDPQSKVPSRRCHYRAGHAKGGTGP